MYTVQTKGKDAVIVDANGVTLGSVANVYNDHMKQRLLTPVFPPDVAETIARALNEKLPSPLTTEAAP